MITTTKRSVRLVMLLIDTSVWIDVFRDRTGETKAHLAALIGEQDFALTRLIQVELLQGCRNEQEWSLLQSYLEGQTYLELNANAWGAGPLRSHHHSFRSRCDRVVSRNKNGPTPTKLMSGRITEARAG